MMGKPGSTLKEAPIYSFISPTIRQPLSIIEYIFTFLPLTCIVLIAPCFASIRSRSFRVLSPGEFQRVMRAQSGHHAGARAIRAHGHRPLRHTQPGLPRARGRCDVAVGGAVLGPTGVRCGGRRRGSVRDQPVPGRHDGLPSSFIQMRRWYVRVMSY